MVTQANGGKHAQRSVKACVKWREGEVLPCGQRTVKQCGITRESHCGNTFITDGVLCVKVCAVFCLGKSKQRHTGDYYQKNKMSYHPLNGYSHAKIRILAQMFW
jgi:hypothetical protein